MEEPQNILAKRGCVTSVYANQRHRALAIAPAGSSFELVTSSLNLSCSPIVEGKRKSDILLCSCSGLRWLLHTPGTLTIVSNVTLNIHRYRYMPHLYLAVMHIVFNTMVCQSMDRQK
jgi:hypothetical protein